jgi:uncharacterized protein YfaS (alpha-2-macroglobulin family)
VTKLPDQNNSHRKLGLKFSLSDGEPLPASHPAVSLADAIPLTEEEAQSVLDRLPPLQAQEHDVKEFSLPAESPPPPSPSKKFNASFPPSVSKEKHEQPAPGPLEVLRYAPEGEVPLVPYLSITFSQPMVALATHEDLDSRDIPVKLTPQPEGRWRWVGTKTLLFEPEDPFPPATHFSVEIPAGLVSAVGGKLDTGLRWHFSTPPPHLQIESCYPQWGEGYSRDTLLFMGFDQKVVPEKVLEQIEVTTKHKTYRTRLASQEEIDANDEVKELAGRAPDGCWLAFRPEEPFPAWTKVVVTLDPEIASAESPVTTTSAQEFSFITRRKLRVVNYGCGKRRHGPPLKPWYIRFSNPLDLATFDQNLIETEPPIPSLKIEVDVDGSTLKISGYTKGRTNYKVTLKAQIQDEFGQTLGDDRVLIFQVDSASPTIYAPGGNMVVLDPSGTPAYSIFTINFLHLEVQIYAVRPDDCKAFQKYIKQSPKSFQNKPRPTPPGRLVLQETVSTNASPDELTETAIDFNSVLDNGFGQFVLLVSPLHEEHDSASSDGSGKKPAVQKWIQVTKIGLATFADHEDLTIWCNSLLDGKPLGGVEVSLLPSGKSTTTDSSGLASLQLPDESSHLVVARRDQDTALLIENGDGHGSDGWKRQNIEDRLVWYVFDDRGIYRPGEKVQLKGWIRHMGMSRNGDITLPPEAARKGEYQVFGRQRQEILSGEFTLNVLGGFDIAFSLPDNMNLGLGMIRLSVVGGQENIDGLTHLHSFQVQEFRRPEFKVAVSSDQGPHRVGGHAQLCVTAGYYAGGGLPDADVTWRVSSSMGQYQPPGWDGFTFGAPRTWRWGRFAPYMVEEQSRIYNGLTDQSGTHRLRIDFESIHPPLPTIVTVESTVMDVNQQAWTATDHLLVHPAQYYVGLRSDRLFVEVGERFQAETIVTDADGTPVPGLNVNLWVISLEGGIKTSTSQGERSIVEDCTLTSEQEPVRCDFTFPSYGAYSITATIEDSNGQSHQSEIVRWARCAKEVPTRNLDQDDVELVPDRDEYLPGDTAEIMVQVPFYPAEALLTLRRSGLTHIEQFTIDSPSITLRVPLEEAHVPNVHVQVDIVGVTPRVSEKGEVDQGLPMRPAFAVGATKLRVPPSSRTLFVEVTPQHTVLEPGGETMLDVLLRNAAGEPVEGGELAVVVVDEAVYSLLGDRTSGLFSFGHHHRGTHPLKIFYPDRKSGVRDSHLRRSIVLAIAEKLIAGPKDTDSPFDTLRHSLERRDPVKVRIDFDALATFVPEVHTDASGHAQIPVKLPDNLTRYRVIVAAAAGSNQFGREECFITARLPLMVRPSAPRFLNFGDRFELPVVVQNQTAEPLDVNVVLRAANLNLTGSEGQRVTIPANNRVEVLFPAATKGPGTASFQAGAVSNRWSDALESKLPVRTPATTESFATYGIISTGAILQPVIAPANSFPQFGGLQITVTSSALQNLSDAHHYLTTYPFECSEQLASRILSLVALRKVLTAFETEGAPSQEEFVSITQRNIVRLEGMQNPDGGFSFWKRGERSWPFQSIHAFHSLLRARNEGFDVRQEVLELSLKYLHGFEEHISNSFGGQVQSALNSYALYVRNLIGDTVVESAQRLVNDLGLERLPLEALGWLLHVLNGTASCRDMVASIHRHLGNRATETAGTAHFVTSYGKEGHVLLHSNRRTDAIILESLILNIPESDLIPKLGRGLFAHRRSGRWSNTQENIFIILAMSQYFSTYETAKPHFEARMWLGEHCVGEIQLSGRENDSHHLSIPMAFVAEHERPDLILSKEGQGRLYYRLGLSYAPRNLQLEAADHGFTLERVYEPVDQAGDVIRDKDGSWLVKRGSRVRVRLTIVAQSQRYYVALVDPLPAGFEPLNPTLAVTENLTSDGGGIESYLRWWQRWYEHQNLRDDRVEAFSSLLWEGVYSYTYIARATTPGEFVVPPAKVEEMYAPETFGRTSSDRVMVE